MIQDSDKNADKEHSKNIKGTYMGVATRIFVYSISQVPSLWITPSDSWPLLGGFPPVGKQCGWAVCDVSPNETVQ